MYYRSICIATYRLSLLLREYDYCAINFRSIGIVTVLFIEVASHFQFVILQAQSCMELRKHP